MSRQKRPTRYLLVGHVARDLTPAGAQLGGTVTYAGLTAAAMGAEVGIITTCAEDVDMQPIEDLELLLHPSNSSTTFINQEPPSGRRQRILSRAEAITPEMVPATWLEADVVHLAPIADEISSSLMEGLGGNALYITPQGWLRCLGEDGTVSRRSWYESRALLKQARAVVCSLEDLGQDQDAAYEMAEEIAILVVTRSEEGAWLFVNGTRYVIEGEPAVKVDPTGSGDIFSAVLFLELSTGEEPLQAARLANALAAASVTRRGLAGIPTNEEIEAARGRLRT